MGIAATDREFCDEEGRCATEFLTTADREQRFLEQETLDRIAALYARGVEYMDQQVAGLRFELESRGLWNDSLVVITSDHGEEFREHGRFLHVQPYVEGLAIPLMVRRPHAAGGGTRVGSIVETVDYLPTLLEAARVPSPSHVQGASLMPLLHGSPGATRFTFGRDKLDLKRYSLRSETHTLVHHLRTGSSELYERANDPAETRDVAGDRPEIVALMTSELTEMVRSSTRLAERLTAAEVEEDLLSAEESEQLRAIGYLE
jgi:arylsulfatase A-like enzyme